MTDKRHNDLHKLSENLDTRRLFSTWAMRGNPVETWMWSYEEVKGALMKNLSAEEANAVFEKTFQRRGSVQLISKNLLGDALHFEFLDSDIDLSKLAKCVVRQLSLV